MSHNIVLHNSCKTQTTRLPPSIIADPGSEPQNMNMICPRDMSCTYIISYVDRHCAAVKSVMLQFTSALFYRSVHRRFYRGGVWT